MSGVGGIVGRGKEDNEAKQAHSGGYPTPRKPREVSSPGQALAFPNSRLFAPRVSWALLIAEDKNSLKLLY